MRRRPLAAAATVVSSAVPHQELPVRLLISLSGLSAVTVGSDVTGHFPRSPLTQPSVTYLTQTTEPGHLSHTPLTQVTYLSDN